MSGLAISAGPSLQRCCGAITGVHYSWCRGAVDRELGISNWPVRNEPEQPGRHAPGCTCLQCMLHTQKPLTIGDYISEVWRCEERSKPKPTLKPKLTKWPKPWPNGGFRYSCYLLGSYFTGWGIGSTPIEAAAAAYDDWQRRAERNHKHI